ncbi:hypothetical protein [Pedobacter sp. GR22-10]|uniref:hypothetical protein n=1 Tax=Pedobacter sp. GR22-10 TaxID=2994472 RepID=UPI002245DB62|nr:hypothetical protein [Pedobacter sp. GR22-10]MCX2430810.1 hypothetical protein [Pedobacter sp. GR22-10]
MNKISVADIVRFVRKTPAGRVTFIANLKKPKVQTNDEGGNYWIISSSAISQVFRSEELIVLDDKVDSVIEKKKSATAKISKDMYQCNIDILHNAKEFDFQDLKPYFSVSYIKNTKSILELRGVPIQIIPNHVFTFEENGQKKVGAIWFVAKKDTYSKEELAIFVYSLHQYLKNMWGNKYEVSDDYCIAFDITVGHKLNYKEIVSSNYQEFIKETLIDLRKAIQ